MLRGDGVSLVAGAFGTIRLARSIETGGTVAIKVPFLAAR